MPTVDYRRFINRNLPLRERACESKAVYVSRGEARARLAVAGAPGCTSTAAGIVRTGTLASAPTAVIGAWPSSPTQLAL